MSEQKSYALILARFTDIPDLPISPDEFTKLLDNLNKYWTDISYNKIDIGNSKVFSCDLPYSYVGELTKAINQGTEMSAITHRDWLMADAKRATEAKYGLNLTSSYYGVIALVNGLTDACYHGGHDFVYSLPGVWGQDQWKFCDKCKLLVFTGVNVGRCAKDNGPHEFPKSFNNCLGHDIPDFPGQQGWRFCKNCGVLVYADDNSANYCISGTEQTNHRHDLSSSFHYVLMYNTPGIPSDHGARWCSKCGGLYFPADEGVCAAGGGHNTPKDSVVYSLTHQEPTGLKPNLSFCTHEMGHTLGLDDSYIDAEGYFDQWDIMSYDCVHATTDPEFCAKGPALNAPNMKSLGWLNESRVWKGGAGSFDKGVVLRPLGQVDLPGYLAAEIFPGEPYLAEFRVNEGWDFNIPHAAVLIHKFNGGHWHLMAGDKGNFDLIAGNSFGDQLPSGKGGEVSLNLFSGFQRVDVISIDPITKQATLRIRFIPPRPPYPKDVGVILTVPADYMELIELMRLDSIGILSPEQKKRLAELKRRLWGPHPPPEFHIDVVDITSPNRKVGGARVQIKVGEISRVATTDLAGRASVSFHPSSPERLDSLNKVAIKVASPAYRTSAITVRLTDYITTRKFLNAVNPK